VDGLGLDFVLGARNLEALRKNGLPDSMLLGAGVVNGRNVWRTDPTAALELIDSLAELVGEERVVLSPSCSLLHLPHSAARENELDPTIRRWLAFATERLDEVAVLRRVASGEVAPELEDWTAAVAARRSDPRTMNAEVRKEVSRYAGDDGRRAVPVVERLARQQAHLRLPPLPTTTIGSFPQTAEVRKARAQHNSGALTAAEYELFLDQHFLDVIRLQEDIGLDVLVHGEFERSDMVDFFAQQLDGMAFIEGWVQSYGTRCVRPPVIYGDIQRRHPMTVDVSSRVQSMTRRPLKGMLTGPVTMLFWSFPRDDLPRPQIADQLALAVRQEARDLEDAGIRIIQIDEPAFREGLPLQKQDWDDYLEWATRAFRLAAGGVRPDTQIHTHMCYSEFNEIMPAIAAMDADVISIENSRSAGELLDVFRDFEYDKGIGPGVYDVHSERVPDVEEIAALLRRSVRVLNPSVLWVNPDCGLKTRGHDEAVAALRNMVDAAHEIRAELYESEPA
jgi:5-methyltetrahydropteroyltriglutamate--homocysteine methyltransferase